LKYFRKAAAQPYPAAFLWTDGGDDFDPFSKLLPDAGFLVLRPQPRGIGASTGLVGGVSAFDQADDIAAVIDHMAGGKAIVIGHAYGHLIAKIVATDHPSRVRRVVLAASQAKHAPLIFAVAPFLAANPALLEAERLAVLEGAFFAQAHDARPWLQRWYPATLAIRRR
jgi:pimeloyl-ACP methyl ester carboxylesterase